MVLVHNIPHKSSLCQTEEVCVLTDSAEPRGESRVALHHKSHLIIDGRPSCTLRITGDPPTPTPNPKLILKGISVRPADVKVCACLSYSAKRRDRVLRQIVGPPRG